MFTTTARGNGLVTSLEATLARVLHNRKGIEMIRSGESDAAPVFFIVAKHFDEDTMERIAMILCRDDVLVQYCAGCNFIRCSLNPMPTPATVPKIQRIPASLDEAVKIARSYGLTVTADETSSGKRRLTVVSNDRPALSEACFELSYRGLHVSHLPDSNFVWVTDAEVVSERNGATTANASKAAV